MDKKTIAFIIAQNGLGTAEGLLQAEIRSIEKKLLATTDPAVKAKLQKDLNGKRELARVLKAADTGIAAYLNPPE